MRTLAAIARDAATKCFHVHTPDALEAIIRAAIDEDRNRFVEVLQYYCTHDDNGQRAQSAIAHLSNSESDAVTQ